MNHSMQTLIHLNEVRKIFYTDEVETHALSASIEYLFEMLMSELTSRRLPLPLHALLRRHARQKYE